MSHDKNGTLIQAGDRVTVEFEVLDVSATEDFCNCKCYSVIPMLPGTSPVMCWFNANQVLLTQKKAE